MFKTKLLIIFTAIILLPSVLKAGNIDVDLVVHDTLPGKRPVESLRRDFEYLNYRLQPYGYLSLNYLPTTT